MLPAHHLDLNEPGFIATPYSQLEDLRMDKPVFFDEAWNKILDIIGNSDMIGEC
jgi:hypothetical protein